MRLMRKTLWLIFFLMCLGVSGYAFYYLHQQFNPANPFHTSFANSGLAVPGHFFASGLALMLAPLQVSAALRRWSAAVHRVLGYTYVLAIVLGGVSGLILAFNAHGGWATGAGFALLAVLWLVFTLLALVYAMRGDIAAHRRWMYRSVALTAAAVSLRIMLGVGLGVLNLPFLTVYTTAAWLCWILNLLLCEWMMRSGYLTADAVPARQAVAAAS